MIKEKILNEWVSHHLITQQQANNIKDYESKKPENRWLIYGLLALGIMVIGIGIVSLIAANWDLISYPAKLAINIILLIVSAATLFRLWKSKNDIAYDTLLLFFLFLCLGCIGLISQVYSIGGELYQALLFWSAITFSAILTANYLFIPLIWVFTCLSSSLYCFSVNVEWGYDKIVIIECLLLPFVCAFLSLITKRFLNQLNLEKSFRISTVVSLVCAIIVNDALHPQLQRSIVSAFEDFYLWGHEATLLYIKLLLLTCCFAGLLAIYIKRDINYRPIQKLLLWSMLLDFLLQFSLALVNGYDVIYATSTIFMLLLLAIYFVSIESKKLFHLFLFFAGIRFFILYFQALGGLATTGLGLITSGIFIIALTILWHKNRKSLVSFIERYVS